MAAPAMLELSRPPRRASVRLRRFLQLWAAGAAAAVAVTAASAAGWLEPLQVRTLDLVQQLGGQRFPPEVVIVAIDEAAFEKLGARQPIPRGYLARVLRGLDRSGAAVVGLDIALSVATTPAEDAALAEALRGLAGGPGRRHRVVLVDARPPESGPLADSTLLAAVPRGSDRVPVDDDGLIRHVAALVPEPGPRPVPAFALAVLGQQALADASPGTAAPGAAPEDLARYPYWRAGGWAPAGGPPTPLRAGELWRVNFVGPRGSFLTIPSDALAELGDPGAPPVAEDNPLRGRIALVGATFPESRDFFQTPVGRLAGVEVHANVVHMLATRALIRPAGWGAALAVQIAVVGLAARWRGRSPPSRSPSRSACPRATLPSTAAGTPWTSCCLSWPRA
jgi:adenylate cyclase